MFKYKAEVDIGYCFEKYDNEISVIDCCEQLNLNVLRIRVYVEYKYVYNSRERI